MLIAGNTPEENFRALHIGGCIQTFADLYTDVEEAMKRGFKRFCQLMVLTRMNPCDGCPVQNGCVAYNQFNTFQASKRASREVRIKKATTANNGPFGSMSVKQIAKEYDTSISQVRRLKVQGKLDTLLEKKDSCS